MEARSPKCPDTGRFQRGEVTLADFRSDNPAYKRMREKAELVARSGRRALLRGPTGSGKTYIALGMHKTSPRAEGPFMEVVMSGLPAHLVYAELFGYLKGAFTGADHESPGYVGRAEGGTLFIDEVTECSLEIQAMLLRLINELMYIPLGGVEKKANVRLLFATNKDVPALVRAGLFREDLWHRIKELVIVVPPLSAHREDVEGLLFDFLTDFGREELAKREAFDDAAWAYIENHALPGNLRDVRTIARRVSMFVRDRKIVLEDVRLEEETESSAPSVAKPVYEVEKLVPLEEMKRRYVCHAVNLSGGSHAEAARILCVSENTVAKYVSMGETAD